MYFLGSPFIIGINNCVMAAMGTRESLKSDVDDEYSLIVTCHETVHVPLPPAYIGSEGRGIKTLLESWKGQYVERLHGVLLGYENLKFVEASGTIIDDQPFVHQDVVGDFQVFRPETGSIVRAHINRMSKNHVGCLVHNWINLSILLPPNPSPELSRYLNMGQEILCKITSVSVYRHNALKLRGSLTSECLKLMGDTIPLIQTSYDDELVEYESNFGDDWNDNCGSDAEVGAQSELCYLEPDEDFSMRPRGQLLSEDGSLTSMEPPQVLQSPEKPKKKRKSVGKEKQASMHASQSSDVPVSQDSEFSAPTLSDSGKTKAKKKKRKREDDDDDGAPTAKKRKEEKKKRGKEITERKKEKRQKKEKMLKMDTEDNASSTVSYSSDRLSASESAFIADIIKKKKKEKMPKVDIENFGSSTASFCSDHLSAAETASIQGIAKKKKKTVKMEAEDIASSTASFCSDRLSTAETASIQDIAEPITIEHELTVSPTKHKKKHKKSKKENGPPCDAGVDSVCSDVSLKVKKKKKKDKMEH